MHFGRNITDECLLSQSVSVLLSFKCSLMMVCLKKMFNGEITLKETEKIVIRSESHDTHNCQVQD